MEAAHQVAAPVHSGIAVPRFVGSGVVGRTVCRKRPRRFVDRSSWKDLQHYKCQVTSSLQFSTIFWHKHFRKVLNHCQLALNDWKHDSDWWHLVTHGWKNIYIPESVSTAKYMLDTGNHKLYPWCPSLSLSYTWQYVSSGQDSLDWIIKARFSLKTDVQVTMPFLSPQFTEEIKNISRGENYIPQE